jgi:hypothetical protein
MPNSRPRTSRSHHCVNHSVEHVETRQRFDQMPASPVVPEAMFASIVRVVPPNLDESPGVARKIPDELALAGVRFI